MATQQQVQNMQNLLGKLNFALQIQSENSFINPIDGAAHTLTAAEQTAIATFITNLKTQIQTLASAL